MVIKIARNRINKIDILNIQGGITASQIYSKYKPDFFINLALYDVASGTNITKMEDENVQSGYLFSDEGMGVEGDNNIKWCTHNEAISNENIRDYVSFSPVLVKNGVKSIDWGNKYSAYVDGKHIRSAIGFNDTEVVLYCSDKELSLNELSSILISEKCKFAGNLDGGGSSHLQEGTKVYKKSIRKNASWLLIYLEKQEGGYEVTKFKNNSSKSLPVYETTACIKKIGSLDPYEECDCLYEDETFRVVLYFITGKDERKVGFVKK